MIVLYELEVLLILGLVFAILLLLFLSLSNRASGSRRSAPETGSAASGRRGSRSGPEPALDILMRRYANGEITRDQYDEMRRDLLA